MSKDLSLPPTTIYAPEVDVTQEFNATHCAGCPAEGDVDMEIGDPEDRISRPCDLLQHLVNGDIRGALRLGKVVKGTGPHPCEPMNRVRRLKTEVFSLLSDSKSTNAATRKILSRLLED